MFVYDYSRIGLDAVVDVLNLSYVSIRRHSTLPELNTSKISFSLFELPLHFHSVVENANQFLDI